MAVASETATLAPLSTDRDAAVAALQALEPWGTTALYDAVVLAMARVDAASGRRALVLLSDGADRYSETSGAAMIEQARRRNVLVYPLILGRSAHPDLVALARVTGGRFVAVTDPDRLSAELEEVVTELRAQYLLGYSSQAPPPDVPTWRAIDVTVAYPGGQVRARDGYLAR